MKKFNVMTKQAISLEIEHIEELYGRDGLILAMKLLKKILDKDEEYDDSGWSISGL